MTSDFRLRTTGLVLLLVTVASPSGLAQTSPSAGYGLEETGRSPCAPTQRLGVDSPEAPLWIRAEDGWPIISEAGYVQLADEGPGFYYGALVGERVGYARRIGMVGTNNWGDIESMALAGRVVARWQKIHPTMRLGLDEISGRYGGFPDYDGDGVSDHLTHQVGTNINFLVPCAQKPELYIHAGVRHDELVDRRSFGDLIDLIVEEGGYRLTTHETLLRDPTAGSALTSKLPWREVERSANGYSITMGLPDRKTLMYLLTPKGDHGDHVNVMMWRSEQ